MDLLHVTKLEGAEEHTWGHSPSAGDAQSLHARPTRPTRHAPEEALTVREELGVGLQAIVVPAEATRVVLELTVQLQLLGEEEAGAGEGLGAHKTTGRGSQGEPPTASLSASSEWASGVARGLRSARAVLAPGVTEDQEGFGTGKGQPGSPGPRGRSLGGLHGRTSAANPRPHGTASPRQNPS